MLRAVRSRGTESTDGRRASPDFDLEVTAVAADIDELGHVSNVTYVAWLQTVAKAHSEAVGWDHEAYKRAGSVFVVRRHEVDYLAPAYAGERLVLRTFVESWSAASSVRRTRIIRAVDGRELVRAATTWAFVSVDGGRPR